MCVYVYVYVYVYGYVYVYVCLKEYAYYTEDFEKQEAVSKEYYDGNSAIGMVE